MNPLTRKLEHIVRFSAEDKSSLDHLASASLRRYAPWEDIMRARSWIAPRGCCSKATRGR